MNTIDLTKLVQALHTAPEEKERSRPALTTEINEYLREYMLPIFAADRYPGLNEVDFDLFEADDLCDFAAYLRHYGSLERSLSQFSDPICQARPKAAKSRAFL